MMLENNYYFFKKAVPIEACEKILKACRTRMSKKAKVSNHKISNVRKCRVGWVQEPWIYDIINPFIHTANKKAGWNFQWDWNETSQFTIYNKSHYYGWHTDQHPNPFEDPSQKFKGKIRKLSLTLQLTDKSKYEGGDFQFRWIDPHQKDLIEVRTVEDAKDIGTIIIFPSFMWHQVMPITKGRRESLVNWSIGEPFK